MKYENFEEVPVWKDGIMLTVKIFEMTQDPSFRGQGDLAHPMQRAALSVPNHIAEGFERGTPPELLQHLCDAKGAAGEVRSICHVLERLTAFQPLQAQLSALRLLAQSIARQLGGWTFSLQESGLNDARHRMDQSMGSGHQQGKSLVFMNVLKKEHEQRREHRTRERGMD